MLTSILLIILSLIIGLIIGSLFIILCGVNGLYEVIDKEFIFKN